MDNQEKLKLQNQLCFPLYSATNKLIRDYGPLLKELDLTYTQYIVMLVLWEIGDGTISEKELGNKIFLKSNTLAPLLAKLKDKGYIEIKKNNSDHRQIDIKLTTKGIELKDKAKSIPLTMAEKINLSSEEALFLYNILYRIINND